MSARPWILSLQMMSLMLDAERKDPAEKTICVPKIFKTEEEMAQLYVFPRKSKLRRIWPKRAPGRMPTMADVHVLRHPLCHGTMPKLLPTM